MFARSGKLMEMDKPMCLIQNTGGNDFEVNKDALKILRSIDQPVVVVSIVGIYRTGKSYLMNRLAGKQTGFSLSSTIQSETKGIWMWCVPHPQKEDQTLVLLDTEGLGDTEKGDHKNDTWIFALAVLLSSSLIYNSMGTISHEALISLQYVTELSKCIKVKAKADDEAPCEFSHIFPNFVWVVRDFTLDLISEDISISADDYLENSLKLPAGNNPLTTRSNAPQDCIRNYFPNRKCFVFDQPVSKAKLKIIDQLSDADLSEEFCRQSSEFCSYILKYSKEKTIERGTRVTGSMLGNLAEMYVVAIQSGQIPCLENSVLTLAKIENSSAVDQAFTRYKQLMEERVVLHTETKEELSSVHEVCFKEGVQLFMDRCFKDDGHSYHNNLMERIREHYTRICKENARLSEDHCKELLQQLWDGVDVQSYMRPGGYADYIHHLQSIIQKYNDNPHKGIMAEKSLLEFEKKKNDLGNTIFKAEQAILEKERQLQEAKHNAEMATLKAENMTQRLADQKKHFEMQMEASRRCCPRCCFSC